MGIAAGLLGGMLGVGGSLLLIPALTLLLGRHQHLFQAAAMMANVAVALPAARRHYQTGVMQRRILVWMLVGALPAVLLGVTVSNSGWFAGEEGGIWLGRLLAFFLIYVVLVNVRLLREKVDRSSASAAPLPGAIPPLADEPGAKVEAAAAASDPRSQTSAELPTGRIGIVGGLMGLPAGLLGIGGGILAVPMQQVLLRLPLRSSIAHSSAIMIFAGTLGASTKVSTLDQHGYAWQDALWIGLLLAPTCMVGSRIGAGLTHRLPLNAIRVVFILILIAAALQMAAFERF